MPAVAMVGVPACPMVTGAQGSDAASGCSNTSQTRSIYISKTAIAALEERRQSITNSLAEFRSMTPEQLAALPQDKLAEIEALVEEQTEVASGLKFLKGQRDAVNGIAEARRNANLGVSGDGSRVEVVSEHPVYGCDGDWGAENSWWADFITAERGAGHPDFQDAMQRRALWGHQAEREIANGSRIGRQFEAQLRDQHRDRDGIKAQRIISEARSRGRVALEDKGEFRGVATGGGPSVSATSGASSFILPAFVGPWVEYREFGRAFADQCAHPDMPQFGMGIFKPVVTGPAGVGAFTELGTVTEVDPTAGFLAGALGIYAGQVVLSQAVLDRVPGDFRYDLAVEQQIQIDEAPKLDNYVLGKALANANVITYNGSFALTTTSGVGGFTGVVGQAKKTMKKTVGTVLAPTHLFMDPAPWEYIEAWSDAQGRPVVVPNVAGPFNALGAGSADGDAGVIEGNTGFKFAGLPAFTDANIPTTGGTANLYQALVCNLREVEFYESNAVNRILPQTLANQLAVIVDRYKYVTVIVNYNAAVQAIQGTAFGTITW